MSGKRFSNVELVRLVDEISAYPAVLWPLPEGGFDVIFTNFPDLRAYGPNREMAYEQARIMLTAELIQLLKDGAHPPRASDPKGLHPDEEEPPGTELVMLEPDVTVLKKRLGLIQQRRESVLSALSQGVKVGKK